LHPWANINHHGYLQLEIIGEKYGFKIPDAIENIPAEEEMME
jgi:hypothetical protein